MARTETTGEARMFFCQLARNASRSSGRSAESRGNSDTGNASDVSSEGGNMSIHRVPSRSGAISSMVKVASFGNSRAAARGQPERPAHAAKEKKITEDGEEDPRATRDGRGGRLGGRVAPGHLQLRRERRARVRRCATRRRGTVSSGRRGDVRVRAPTRTTERIRSLLSA